MPSCRHLVLVVVLLSLGGWTSSEPPKVRLGLYYESLCPYSAEFIARSLPRMFMDRLIAVVDLELYPYGNAKIDSNGTVTCQHGPYECFLNVIEACAINVWPEVTVHFQFIYCVEKLVVEGRYTEWDTCFQKLSLKSQPVLDCFYSGYGKQLELYYAEETDALEPPHKYVPWVVVDGRPLYDDYENFEAEVCKAYTGELPEACEKLVLAISPKKNTKHAQACYANEEAPSSSQKM